MLSLALSLLEVLRRLTLIQVRNSVSFLPHAFYEYSSASVSFVMAWMSLYL